MKDRMKQYNLRLRQDQIDRLKTVSKETGTSASDLIRRAIDLWLVIRRARMERPSTLEEMAAQDDAMWYGDPDAGVPVEGIVKVGDVSVHT